MADSGDARWFTYRELADALGITYRAAEARARRNIRSGKWAYRRDNDAPLAARVQVSAAEMDAMRQDAVGSAVGEPHKSTAGGTAGDTVSHTINALLAELKASQGAIAGLHERVGRAEGEVAALQGAIAHERQAREAAERDAEGLRGTLAHERQALASEREALGYERQAREAAEAAQAAAETARDAAQQETAEWASGGPLTRAWRGFWRGRP